MKRLLILSLFVTGGCAGPALFGYQSWPPQNGQGGPGTQPAGTGWNTTQGPATRPGTQPGMQAGSQPAMADPMQPASTSNSPANPSANTPLLSWDGGVVAGPEGGEVVADSTPGHGIEPEPAGRMHIIELYQGVLDERDALFEEVAQLSAALQRSEEKLSLSGSSVQELTARITALEEEKALLLAENHDLAGRLTTAQIRRLEAEKLLLETRIQWHREERGDVNLLDGSMMAEALQPIRPPQANRESETDDNQ